MSEQNKAEAIKHNNEFIAFLVHGQEFCIDIRSIREIRGWNHATRLPHVPDYVTGVMNLRGTILPIVDISNRFGMGACEPTKHNVVIVSQIGDRLVGMLVDSVSDILQVGDDQIRGLPDIDSDIARAFLSRVVVYDSRIICEVALENLFPRQAMEAA